VHGHILQLLGFLSQIKTRLTLFLLT